MEGEDVRIRMAFPAQPEPAMVDDLQLRVRLEDGTILLPDRFEKVVCSHRVYPEVADTNDTAAFPQRTKRWLGLTSHRAISSAHRTSMLMSWPIRSAGRRAGNDRFGRRRRRFALIVKGLTVIQEPTRRDGTGVEQRRPCPSTYAPVEFDADGTDAWTMTTGTGCRTGTMRVLRALPFLTTQIETGAWTMTTGTAFPTPKTCARPSPSLLLLM